eukprot:6913767-Lingulodinium_polyedra.AAC.1
MAPRHHHAGLAPRRALGHLPPCLGGGGLWDLACAGVWGFPDGTAWKDRANIQLARACSDFRAWLKEHGYSCSQGRFSVNKISMRTLACWPRLKAKGYNSLM